MMRRRSRRTPFLVGIGGQAGAGKTQAARYFAALGAEVVDADRLGWQLLKRSAPTSRRVVQALGRNILNARGAIDRARVAQIVFRDRRALARLNRIVHPALLAEIRRRLRARGRCPVRVLDAALLFFWGLEREMDISILVTARQEKKLARLVKNGLGRAAALARLKSQLPDRVQRQRADLIIENNGTRRQLWARVRQVWRLLQSC